MNERAAELRSGKGHGDENFPVASHLIHPRHRPAILAFYNFVRTADDIADHPTLGEAEKLALLDRMESGLLRGGGDAEAVALRDVLQQRGLAPQHAQDLLTAFRLDVTKRRYKDWDDLIGYCTYSAMPVGRFVLDVHGESRATWPLNDALCAALQIINHLQDCGKDYRDLDRVYIPLDALRRSWRERRDAGRAAGRGAAARLPGGIWRSGPRRYWTKAGHSPRPSHDLRLSWRFPSSTPWRNVWWACWPARSAQRACASRQGRRRRAGGNRGGPGPVGSCYGSAHEPGPWAIGE